jgi:hypothetical protein
MELQIIPGLEEVLAGMRPGGNEPWCLQSFDHNVMRQFIKFLLKSHVDSKRVEDFISLFVLSQSAFTWRKLHLGGVMEY